MAYLLLWIVLAGSLALIDVQSSSSGYHPSMIGLASMDRVIPLFVKPILTLGSVSLNTTKYLPDNANQMRSFDFDNDDDEAEYIHVEVEYMTGDWYHGSFTTTRATVNFIYCLGPKSKETAAVLKKLWQNSSIK